MVELRMPTMIDPTLDLFFAGNGNAPHGSFLLVAESLMKDGMVVGIFRLWVTRFHSGSVHGPLLSESNFLAAG